VPTLSSRAAALAATIAIAACARPAPPAAATESLRPGGAIAQIACGDFHACALYRDGAVRCWGRDRNGELGDAGAAGEVSAAGVDVAGLGRVEEIAAGASFTCARAEGGTVLCWGSGKILGDGRAASRVRPTPVAGVRGAASIRAGGYVACVRTADGAARCWGTSAVERGAPPSAGVSEVDAASAHACARMTDGKVRCWGEGPWGGEGAVAFDAPPIAGARSVATGDSFGCAAEGGGAVQCWGRNDEGELGINPDENNHVEPVAVRFVTGAVKVDAGESHACALLASGAVWCWGSNTEGELGRGVQSVQELAAPVPGIPPARDVAMGADFVCALGRDDSLFCWGSNGKGQLGDGTTADRFAPVRVARPR